MRDAGTKRGTEFEARERKDDDTPDGSETGTPFISKQSNTERESGERETGRDSKAETLVERRVRRGIWIGCEDRTARNA